MWFPLGKDGKQSIPIRSQLTSVGGKTKAEEFQAKGRGGRLGGGMEDMIASLCSLTKTKSLVLSVKPQQFRKLSFYRCLLLHTVQRMVEVAH